MVADGLGEGKPSDPSDRRSGRTTAVRVLRWVGRGIVGLLLLAVIAVVAGYMVLRQTVPSMSGQLAIAGLSAPVQVVRDREGVPHIFAKTTGDLYRALGFVHAQDRLWQMELQRRAGQGRLSELFGDRTYATDVFLRTLDLHGYAERSLAALPADVLAALEAYAEGVNAFLTRRVGAFEPRLPPEFLLLRHEPEPWRAADSAVIAKLMALRLSMNLNHELLRLSLAAQRLTAAEIDDLLPSDDAAEPPPPLPPPRSSPSTRPTWSMTTPDSCCAAWSHRGCSSRRARGRASRNCWSA